MITEQHMEIGRSKNRLPERLRRKSEFRLVIGAGRRFRQEFLRLHVYPVGRGAGSSGRVGFVVPERIIGGSVRRNRMKRLLREAVRQWWKYIRPGFDIVLVVSGEPRFDKAAYVESVFVSLLDRSGFLTEEGVGKLGERMAGKPMEFRAKTGRGEKK